MFLVGGFLTSAAFAGPLRFEHIVVIVQENRTPDNLFYALCSRQRCSTHPDATSYDIQTANWLDKNAKHGTVQPGPVPLANTYDIEHTHTAFVAMCDFDSTTNTCRMDGAGDIHCGQCPLRGQFKFVDNSSGSISPYLSLATQYGWANYMFQTNQGPSFPAHQFLFGATSAPNRRDDHKGVFVSENLTRSGETLPDIYGCIAHPGTLIQLINAFGLELPTKKIYPCFEHLTLADLLDRHGVTWRYYTPGAGDLWSAPDAIRHICEPSNRECTGAIWQKNVALNPVEALTDIGACNLRGVSWIIPSAQFSDHAKINVGAGPSWVAKIVDAIGNSSCRNSDRSSYWDSTAILITWDDWGGWYDHEAPTILAYPQGGYQYGFRVPFLFVSAYTRRGYINNQRLDFGSIARFVEKNFGIRKGALTFADARADQDLSDFYNFAWPTRAFETIFAPEFPTQLRARSKLEPPDDD